MKYGAFFRFSVAALAFLLCTSPVWADAVDSRENDRLKMTVTDAVQTESGLVIFAEVSPKDASLLLEDANAAWGKEADKNGLTAQQRAAQQGKTVCTLENFALLDGTLLSDETSLSQFSANDLAQSPIALKTETLEYLCFEAEGSLFFYITASLPDQARFPQKIALALPDEHGCLVEAFEVSESTNDTHYEVGSGQTRSSDTATQLTQVTLRQSESLTALEIVYVPSISTAKGKVYATSGGIYYHSEPHCSGMKHAKTMSLSEAKALGKLKCPACFAGNSSDDSGITARDLSFEFLNEDPYPLVPLDASLRFKSVDPAYSSMELHYTAIFRPLTTLPDALYISVVNAETRAPYDMIQCTLKKDA